MKRSANLSIDANLLDEAKGLDINLSQTLEAGLRREVALRRAERWRRDNIDAVDGYNSWVEEHGLPLEKYRQF